MEVLWDHGPMKMAAIIEVLMPQTNWSRTTIATLTSRLENKVISELIARNERLHIFR